MSQLSLPTLSNGGVVNDLPKFKIEASVPDVAKTNDKEKKARRDGIDSDTALSGKRRRDSLEEKLKAYGLSFTYLQQEVKRIATKVEEMEKNIKKMELEIGGACTHIKQLQDGMEYVRGCCRVCYAFVKRAEAEFTVSGWKPCKKEYKFE